MGDLRAASPTRQALQGTQTTFQETGWGFHLEMLSPGTPRVSKACRRGRIRLWEPISSPAGMRFLLVFACR